MKNKNFVLTHPSQLNSLSPLPLLHRRGVGQIVFNGAFDHPDKKRWEKELNKHFHACGCSHGAKGLLLGLLFFAIICTAGFNYTAWTISETLTIFFVGTIGMSLAGKLAGLIIAGNKLKNTVKEIQLTWKPEWPESTTITGCG